MKIHHLSPTGVLQEEQAALREMEKTLPKEWVGYSAFQLVPQFGNPLDIDLLLLTPHRLLLIELKNWSGVISDNKGQWFKDSAPRGKSPVWSITDKARKLANILTKKLAANEVPYIEAFVVTCHPQHTLSLSEGERKRTFTLAELLALKDPKKYDALFPIVHPEYKRASVKPLTPAIRLKYELLFKSTAIKPRAIEVNNYKQEDETPDFEHPEGLYREFFAGHVDNANTRGLLRLWNFENLDGGNCTQLERANIALREARINEHLRNLDSPLQSSLLEPVGSSSERDVTTHFAEVYRLPPKLERLDEFLNRRPDLESEQRWLLVKAVLSRYAELHDIGIAHRDIGPHSIWVREPAIFVMSSFAAAYFPEKETVGVRRVQVEAGATKLPEDLVPNAVSDPFRRDVFLLGTISYFILFGHPLPRVQGVPSLPPVEANGDRSLALGWLQCMLATEPGERPKRAREALDALNALQPTSTSAIVSEVDFEPYKSTVSPALYPQSQLLSMKGGKWVYRCTTGDRDVVVKFWTGLQFDPKRSDRNERLLAFLQLARTMQTAPTDDFARIVDFGVGPLGLGLVVDWLPGRELGDWARGASDEQRSLCAVSLLRAVERLHSAGIFHGDLKPSNLLVVSDPESGPLVRFVDLPDLRPDGDEGHTPAYSPPTGEVVSSENRDRYAAAIIAKELIGAVEALQPAVKEIDRALEQAEAGVPIDLIADTIESLLRPAESPTLQEFRLGFLGRPPSLPDDNTFPSDNGRFQIGVELPKWPGEGAKVVIFHVAGVTDKIRITVNRDTKAVLEIKTSRLTHVEYVRSSQRSKFSIEARLRFQHSANYSADELVRHLLERALQAGLLEGAADDEREAELAQGQTLDEPAHGHQASSTRVLWQAMADSEMENAVAVTVQGGAELDPADGDLLYVPYSLDGGTLDFEPDERVQVFARQVDRLTGEHRWRPVGQLDVARTTDSRLAVRDRWSGFSIEPETQYRLRGQLEDIALQRKQQAMKRILAGEALIRNLPDYFDSASSLKPYVIPLPETIDWDEYGLNPEQREAMETALSRGPLALLQGPPGTGKTKFISVAAHVLLTYGLAQRILLVSQSHEAVNHALTKLLEIARKTGKPLSAVRVGQESQLSPPVRRLHHYYQQQVFRERFVSEEKDRIRTAAASLGLPPDFVREAIDLFFGPGQLVKEILATQRRIENQKLEKDVAEHEVRRLSSLTETFRNYVEGRYDSVVGSREPAAVLHDLATSLSRAHGSPSPAKVERLRKLVDLSSEFKQVLGNPQANFSAFLTRTCEVVAGTCVGIGRSSYGITDCHYDWVIIDEAARSSPTELAVAMQAGRRVLLVGDHEQLPPTYSPDFAIEVGKRLQQSRVNLAEVNDVRRAFNSHYGQQVGRTLTTQYRMASAIGQLVSYGFYEKRLKTGRKEPSDVYGLLPALFSHQVIWVDTSDRGKYALERSSGEGEIVNEAEATAALDVLQLIASSADFVARLNEEDEEEPPIGVICMYAAQRNLIQSRLQKAEWAAPIRHFVKVGTVDSYQGKENRIVLLSFVRNNVAGNAGFLSLKARINVAVSRAKDRLIMFGSASMWTNRRHSGAGIVLHQVKQLHSEGRATIVASKDLVAKEAA